MAQIISTLQFDKPNPSALGHVNGFLLDTNGVELVSAARIHGTKTQNQRILQMMVLSLPQALQILHCLCSKQETGCLIPFLFKAGKLHSR